MKLIPITYYFFISPGLLLTGEEITANAKQQKLNTSGYYDQSQKTFLPVILPIGMETTAFGERRQRCCTCDIPTKQDDSTNKSGIEEYS